MRKLNYTVICLLPLASQLACPAIGSEVIWAELVKAGKDALRSNESGKALQLFQASLKEAESDRSEPEQIQSLIGLARVYAVQENYQLAESTLKKAQVKAYRNPSIDPSINDRLKATMVDILKRQNKDLEATELQISMAEKSWKEREAAAKNDPFELGVLYYECKNFPKAQPLLERAFRDFTQESDFRGGNGLRCVDMLYMIYRDTRQYDKAEKHLEHALEICKEEKSGNLSYSFAAGNIFLYLAGLFAVQGRNTEAEAMANKATDIFFAVTGPAAMTGLPLILGRWEKNGKPFEAKSISSFLQNRITKAQQNNQARNADWEEEQPDMPKPGQ